MAISISTKQENSQRIVEIECTANDYLNAKSELEAHVRTGLRMSPDFIQIKIKKEGES